MMTLLSTKQTQTVIKSALIAATEYLLLLKRLLTRPTLYPIKYHVVIPLSSINQIITNTSSRARQTHETNGFQKIYVVIKDINYLYSTTLTPRQLQSLKMVPTAEPCPFSNTIINCPLKYEPCTPSTYTIAHTVDRQHLTSYSTNCQPLRYKTGSKDLI